MTRWALGVVCDDDDYPQNCPDSGQCIGLGCHFATVWVYDPGFIDADNNGGLDLFLTEEQVSSLELRLREE